VVEEVGWLKVLFAAAIAVLGSVATWIGSVTDGRIRGILGLGFVFVIIGAFAVVRKLYRLLNELDVL
jgi:hypothetical protein